MPKKFFMRNKILVALLLSLALAKIVSAAGISFTTESRTVAPDAVSEVITVSLDEVQTITTHLTFELSSATGKIVNSNGEPILLSKFYISKGDRNKNFYYKDSSMGVFTITISTVENGWQATQNITVESGGSLVGDDSSDFDDSSDSISGHSETKELTTLEKKETFKIGAGRKRVAVVGAPVHFEAVVNKGDEQAHFEWSFGDGAKVRGRLATHAYYFPGNYNVVLTGELGDEVAIARTQVEVTAPELSIASVAGGTKIYNPNKQEVNLVGWRLAVGDKDFVIPNNTLIDPNGTIIIPSKISRLPVDPSEVVLQNPSGEISSRFAGLDQEKVKALQIELAKAEAQLVQLLRTKPVPGMLQLAQVAGTSTTAATETVIELPRKSKWWARLIDEVF